MFKVKFWSNVTPSVLMVSENGMGVPAIIGDAIGGRVRRRWRGLCGPLWSFAVLCGSLQTLAVPSGPLRCLLWSLAVLCGPLRSFVVFSQTRKTLGGELLQKI